MLLFNSFFYLIFLLVAIFGYYVTPKKYRYITLLVFSMLFYASFSYKFLFFIASTIVTIYLATMFFQRVDSKQKQYFEDNKDITSDEKKLIKKKNKKRKKFVFVIVILFNIGVLFALKYLNFFGGMVNSIASHFTHKEIVPHFNLILPLGISFYTFQALGYLIDAYWGNIQPQKNFLKFALFISFFPQLVQGPISRYNQIGKQLEEGSDFNYDNIVRGFQLIVWGLFKKMVVADLFSNVVNSIFNNYSGVFGKYAIAGIILYFFQDYADFSGCIDIARGSAECLGIKMPQNFERPYFALSISDYWRRWHMTLGTWFKDYIFYPISVSKFSLKLGKISKKLFGNFGKNIPAIVGLLITWLVTGLWHGASWNYIVWGLYFGVLIVLQIITKPLCEKLVKKLKINTKNIFWKLFSWVRTIILLLIGRTIFRAPTLKASFIMLINCFKFNSTQLLSFSDSDIKLCKIALVGFILVMIVDFIKEIKPDISIRQKLSSMGFIVSSCVFLLLIAMIIIFGAYGISKSMSDFIYMQF